MQVSSRSQLFHFTNKIKPKEFQQKEANVGEIFFSNTISRNETEETRYGFASICTEFQCVPCFNMVERQPFYYFEAEKDWWDHFVTSLTYAYQVIFK